MTLNQLEQEVKTDKSTLYIRFDDLQFDSKMVLDAVKQIKRSVVSIQSGITHPEDHRAEAMLLLILNNAISFKGV